MVDVETTITDEVADFAAVICDRNGTIYHKCAVLVAGVFGVKSLFYDTSKGGADSLWSKTRLEARMANYADMIARGDRIIASTAAINKWLHLAVGKYNPTLTAYNIAFDKGKCANTGIDLSAFKGSFCLWHATAATICKSKEYRRFVLENHLFNAPTGKGNMTYQTNAEAVTSFLRGEVLTEPHTALEDVLDFEIPVLTRVIRLKNWREAAETRYNWTAFQVKHHFKV